MGLWKHVKARRKQNDFSGGYWQLASVCSAWLTNNTDDIASSELWVNISKGLKAFMVVDVTHNLKSFSITLQIIKDEVLSLGPNVGDSTSQRNSLLKELAFFTGWIIFSNKLRKSNANVELVWVRVCLRGLFELIDHIGSVLIVLSWIKDDLFLLFLLLFSFLLGLLFSFFLSFFSCKSFLFFQSFLLIFAQLLLAFSDGLTFMNLSGLSLNFLFSFLLSWLLNLLRVLFHLNKDYVL